MAQELHTIEQIKTNLRAAISSLQAALDGADAVTSTTEREEFFFATEELVKIAVLIQGEVVQGPTTLTSGVITPDAVEDALRMV